MAEVVREHLRTSQEHQARAIPNSVSSNSPAVAICDARVEPDSEPGSGGTTTCSGPLDSSMAAASRHLFCVAMLVLQQLERAVHGVPGPRTMHAYAMPFAWLAPWSVWCRGNGTIPPSQV